jgi:hypothetical protein
MTALAGEIECLLKKSGSVTLDANGSGVLTFDPDNANQRWEVMSVVVTSNQSATSTVIPVATLALNTVTFGTLSPGNQRGASWSGSQDTFTGLLNVGAVDYLTIMFTPTAGASPSQISALVGSICTAIVSGNKYTRRR